MFYWAAVVATFAMGTALGDLTATTFGLGYLASGLLFAAVIAVPAIGYWRLRWNAIFSLLVRLRRHPAARRVVRRLDGQAARASGGLGLGDGTVALALTIMIFCLVAFLAITRRDVQTARPGAHGDQARRPLRFEPASESTD